jgi:hypothetical protein
MTNTKRLADSIFVAGRWNGPIAQRNYVMTSQAKTRISATVVGGRGIASQLRSSELKEMSAKHGLNLVDGSLNLISRQPFWLDTNRSFFHRGNQYYWHAALNGTPVVMNRWLGTCPVHAFEVFASEHLRSKFKLADGDQVALEICVGDLHSRLNSSKLNRLVWYLGWFGRERFFYGNGAYQRLILHWRVHPLFRRAYQPRSSPGH